MKSVWIIDRKPTIKSGLSLNGTCKMNDTISSATCMSADILLFQIYVK